MIIQHDTISLDNAITLVKTDEWKWGNYFGALLSEAQKEMTDEQQSILVQTIPPPSRRF